MQQQTSFLDVLLQNKSRKTRREVFLSQMEKSIPWALLVALIEPFYPKGKRGRPPIGIERMLRLYFVQLWYNFSDEGTEDALYDMPVLARFVGIDLTFERVPDSTTLKNFRHLLEENELAPKILDQINALLADKGADAQRVDHRGCNAHSGTPPRPRTKTKHAILRCTKPRRATSGTSG